MKIFGKTLEFRKASKQETSHIQSYSIGGTFLQSNSQPLLLSTVYRCVDVISDAVASLPLEVYKLDNQGFKTRYTAHSSYYLLNKEPNSDMTRFTWLKLMCSNLLLNGNAYSYISRNEFGQVDEIIYLPANFVNITWITDNQGIKRKRYQVNGFRELVEPKDMIHVLQYTSDGILGRSVISFAAQTISIATDSEAYAQGIFKNGGNISGILSVEGVNKFNAEQKNDVYKVWSDRTSNNSNGIIILEGGMKYQPISISPEDSQLLASRKFNCEEICRFFGVSPIKAFQLDKASYASVEMSQLAFLTDTIQPYLVKFELEFCRKIFLKSEQNYTSIEFNTNEFLRSDKTAQSNWYKNLWYLGCISINEIRKDINLSPLEDGNKCFVPVNVQTLSNAVNAAPYIKPKDNNLLNDNVLTD